MIVWDMVVQETNMKWVTSDGLATDKSSFATGFSLVHVATDFVGFFKVD